MKEEQSGSELTIEAIFDLRTNPQAAPVHTDSYLSAMSEAEWSELRAIATRSGRTESPALRCGDCRAAIYARESSKGRRHCYHFAGDHSGCRWSGAVAGNIRSIDAAKFQGQQEGEQHKLQSRLISEVLELDPDTRKAGVSFRRYTKLADGEYAYPDVYADDWQGAPAAFEIQLSTTHLPVITRREDFYERASIRLAWIVGHQGDGLSRRAFRDIYMRNDGQVLGMDGEVAAEARKAGMPRFRLCRLLPGSPESGFAPQWRDKIVGPEEIDWGAPGDRPRSVNASYDSYLDMKIEKHPVLAGLRQSFYEALKTGNEANARLAWDAVAKKVGGAGWNEFPSSYDLIRALGTLATVRTGTLHVPTDIPAEQLTNLVNSMLLQPRERRCWTHAFELLCRAKGLHELLALDSVRKKCERNKSDMLPALPADRKAGPVFNAFFPEGTFYRLELEE